MGGFFIGIRQGRGENRRKSWDFHKKNMHKYTTKQLFGMCK
jgi:hypothetical protein